MAQSFEERFWARVNKDAPDGCWEWTGSLNAYGYGQVRRGKKVVGTHRVGWELLVETIPVDMCTDHLCRNRKCCNPAHLEIVTKSENSIRAVKFWHDVWAYLHGDEIREFSAQGFAFDLGVEIGRSLMEAYLARLGPLSSQQLDDLYWELATAA